MKKQLAVALAAIMIFSSGLLVLLPHGPSALAQYSWTDTIKLYKDVNAVYSNVRKITNNETVAVDVNVYITFTQNINLLEYYKLSANGTDFIAVSQGSITLSGGTYPELGQGQALWFNVVAEGASSLSEGDAVAIGVKVEFWSAAYKHDVTVTAVDLSKTVVGQGFSMDINATVHNLGNFTETFDVTAYANETIFATIANITLASENSTTITFTWNTTGFAKGNYTIRVYAGPVPGETDVNDNTFTDGWAVVAMVGDVTGPDGWPDGKVDMRDIASCALRFGCILVHPPPPCWDPNYDLNNDGKIDIRDIAAIAIHFGEVDP